VRVLSCVFAALALCACGAESPSRAVDPLEFTRTGDNLVLAFDLRKDSDPLAAVIVNRGTLPAGQTRTLVLPFATTRPSNDAGLASATGHYNTFTVVSFVYGGTGSGAITAAAVLSVPPQAPYDLAQLQGPIYLIRSGLQRDFLLRYPSAIALDHVRPPHLRALAKVPFDTIAVALPSDATGREIEAGRTAIPAHISANSTARFYPATPPPPQMRALHIRYDVPANTAQKAVADSLLSFVPGIFIPIIGLVLMAPGDIRRPGARRLVIILAGTLELVILLWLSVVAWRSYDSLEATFFINAAAAFVGAVLSGVALWIKWQPGGSASRPTTQ